MDESADPIAQAKALVEELGKFDEELEEKPRWIVLNKIDLVPEQDRATLIETYRRELGAERPIFVMSAATREGTTELIKAIAQELEQSRQQFNARSDALEDVRFSADRENDQENQ